MQCYLGFCGSDNSNICSVIKALTQTRPQNQISISYATTYKKLSLDLLRVSLKNSNNFLIKKSKFNNINLEIFEEPHNAKRASIVVIPSPTRSSYFTSGWFEGTWKMEWNKISYILYIRKENLIFQGAGFSIKVFPTNVARKKDRTYVFSRRDFSVVLI